MSECIFTQFASLTQFAILTLAKVHKLNVVAQRGPGRTKKTWDEVLVDDRN